jgi:uncharacterized FAD-dependent dehydrogenase
MKLLVRQIRQAVGESDKALMQLVAAQTGLDVSQIRSARILRRSLDARRKQDVHFLLTVLVDTDDAVSKRLLAEEKDKVSEYKPPQAVPLKQGMPPLKGRVVVAGLGPAGLFSALLLARNGYRPLVIERGEPVERRARAVECYWQTGELSEESNVMFGEGGAGTFSDGKLTSRSKDPRGEAVLQTLTKFGAPEEIRILAKPHIGTDRLRSVVSCMRREIERLGGEVFFSAKLTGIESSGGVLNRIRFVRDREMETIDCAALVLAIGQGARDTYRMLFDAGVAMAKKPFAAGVRIEHPQSMIDNVQFGAFAGHPRLGAAEYALSARSGERGVYTFCMCPGGSVIASASAHDEIVVNGMSDFARSAPNANAALVVQVKESDLEDDPLAGLRFQKRMEQAAFIAGGKNGFAPSCTVGSFLGKRIYGFGQVEPSYRPGVTEANLKEILPEFIAKGIADGIEAFGRQMRGFDREDAVLTGVETRTSAPLRILRSDTMQSVSCAELYPVGEGAGYAGGIVSAAIDGMKAAERIIAAFAPPK